MGSIGMPELIILLFFFVIPLILTVAALISCLMATFSESINKLVWVIVIVFVPVIGAILYFAISPKQRLKA